MEDKQKKEEKPDVQLPAEEEDVVLDKAASIKKDDKEKNNHGSNGSETLDDVDNEPPQQKSK